MNTLQDILDFVWDKDTQVIERDAITIVIRKFDTLLEVSLIGAVGEIISDIYAREDYIDANKIALKDFKIKTLVENEILSQKKQRSLERLISNDPEEYDKNGYPWNTNP